MDSLESRPPRKLIEPSDKNRSFAQETEALRLATETSSTEKLNKATEKGGLWSEVPSSIPYEEASSKDTTTWREKSLVSSVPESDLLRKEVEPELPPVRNDDGEVFWDGNESLPPPPPLDVFDPLETSQDNLPLPSPPREVLVEFPPSPREPNLRSSPVHTKPTSVNNDVVLRDEIAVVESSNTEAIPELRIDENGHGKINASGEREQTLENTSSTDSSFNDTSPSGSKKESSRAPPPSPLRFTSTPTKDESAEVDTPLENSASPYSMSSTTSTPSGSRPNSLLSPKLEALDKEKVG